MTLREWSCRPEYTYEQNGECKITIKYTAADMLPGGVGARQMREPPSSRWRSSLCENENNSKSIEEKHLSEDIPLAVVKACQVGEQEGNSGGQAAGEESGAGDTSSVTDFPVGINAWDKNGYSAEIALVGVALWLGGWWADIPALSSPSDCLLLCWVFIQLMHSAEMRALPWLRWLPLKFSHILPHIPWDALVLLSAF